MSTTTKSTKMPKIPAELVEDKELDSIWQKVVETTDESSLTFGVDTLISRITDKSEKSFSPSCLEFLTMDDETMAEFFVEKWLHVGNTEAAMNLMEAIYKLKTEYRVAFSGGSKTSPWWDKF